jgi:hypothetical protein
MNNKLFRIVLICFVIGFFTFSFNSIVFAGGSFTFKWGNNSEPEQQQVKHKHKHKKKGPPAHAPAHGYRAKHKYRYYPDCKVYHDTDRGVYFYLKGDTWEVGASLPLPLKDSLGTSVSLELDIDKPYTQNDEHIKQYSSNKSKGKKKKKWVKK